MPAACLRVCCTHCADHISLMLRLSYQHGIGLMQFFQLEQLKSRLHIPHVIAFDHYMVLAIP